MKEKTVRQWKKVYVEDLSHLVSELKDSLEMPAMMLLTGDLGSGKTTFTQIFSGDETLTSPTYSLVSEGHKLLHADFYRIKDEDELYQVELPLYLENKECFLVEWGAPYTRFLNREIPDEFKFYQLTIRENKQTEHPSRDYELTSIDRNSL